MKKLSELTAGDPVEVRVIVLSADGDPMEHWIPATVVFANSYSISVAYADGRKEALQTRGGFVRPAR